MKIIIHFIFVLLIILFEAQLSNSQHKLLYKNHGQDWIGLCNTGKMQSPINIIEGGNTVEDLSYVNVNYQMNENAIGKKFYFDGERLYANMNLGNIVFKNHLGSQEIYEMKRIELHMPAEHYVTKNGHTQIYSLELQIYHDLISSTNPIVTNKVLPVRQAVISMLYTIGDKEYGDIFLEHMGISQFNIDDRLYKFQLPSKGQHLETKIKLSASYRTGMSYLAFQGLLNDINADQHLFFYYGSETLPPCKENVLWMVFANPRSISQVQFDYLFLILVKNMEKGKSIVDTNAPSLVGNKRTLIFFEQFYRPKVLSNQRGLKHTANHNFFLHKNEN